LDSDLAHLENIFGCFQKSYRRSNRRFPFIFIAPSRHVSGNSAEDSRENTLYLINLIQIFKESTES